MKGAASPLLAGVLVVATTGCDPDATDADRPEPGTIAAPTPPHPLRVRPVARSRPERTLLILVNTASELYRVDPVSLDLTLLGEFSFPTDPQDRITDIAVDFRGRMWGVGFDAVYAIDPGTLECTRLARHRGLTLNALAIMTSAMTPGREAPDVMLAAQSRDPTVFQVDQRTGELTPVGDVGGGLSSSGDLTWAPGLGAMMLASDFAGYEGLAHLAPDTFTATRIGPGWPFHKVRGLTMLPTGLLAVTEQGEMLEIDPRTGDAILRRSHPLVFYGAAIGWDDAKP